MHGEIHRHLRVQPGEGRVFTGSSAGIWWPPSIHFLQGNWSFVIPGELEVAALFHIIAPHALLFVLLWSVPRNVFSVIELYNAEKRLQTGASCIYFPCMEKALRKWQFIPTHEDSQNIVQLCRLWESFLHSLFFFNAGDILREMLGRE